MANRVEKLSVTKSPSGTLVKVIITEDGVPVSYAVKTYESTVTQAIKDARRGAERLLAQVRAALEVEA